MSLLTPPNTSHRADKEKENKFPEPPVAGPSSRSVVWAPKDIIHSLATPVKHVSISSKQRPSTTKSILKPLRENYLQELPQVVQKRETTPEPEDPLVDLHYFDHPVDQILSNGGDEEQALHNLTEGYNILAARIRSCVAESTDADASWPIFQPLRKNAQAFVDAMERDVKRALVNPLLHKSTPEQEASKFPVHTLPSPATSPAKKKGGLSEEQVKYARDLGATCHAVIKLLAAILCIPAVYNLFDEKQLGSIITAVLSIPLADDLPTPNARKTCALAIWLIQVQRLPAAVLKPAASRIAYALRRGLDGELGKEGKKGSANDGLKAIHDLCVYLPEVFIPAFTPLLPSVLANLLAPTLALRTQACHALGGFVNGSAAIPVSAVHTKIANTVAAYVTTATPSPTKLGKSPTKPAEAAIVRTLRTTLNNTEPIHVASGPVWGISVCASFLALLGARLSTDTKVTRIITSLLNLGMRHEKSSVRALTCAVWRTIAWAYFRPALPVEDEDESEVDEDSYMQQKHARLAHCKVMMSVVDCQAGVSTIAGLLGDDSAVGDEPLRLSLNILQLMTLKAGITCRDAVEALQQMVSGAEPSEPWNMKLLLPSKLFSANPGLLTADFKNMAKSVREIYDQLAMVHDIRCLTQEELTKDWVFRGMMAAWRTALGCLEMDDSAELPGNLNEIWSNLLQANVSVLQETGDEDALASFASSAMKYIIHVIEDPKLNLMPRKPTDKPTATAVDEVVPDSDETIPEYKGNNICGNGELRMRVAYRMWSTMRIVFPHETIRDCAETFLATLLKKERLLVNGTEDYASSLEEETIDQACNAWVGLCADVLLLCETDTLKTFWSCVDEYDCQQCYPPWTRTLSRSAWKIISEKWAEGEGSWEGGIVLLGVPFTDLHTWGPTSEDYSLWENLLKYTTGKALDIGVDSSVVLDNIAQFVSCFQSPGASPGSSLRLADLLLSHIDAADMRELPMNIIELVSETMCAMYPPAPRVRHFAMWVVRSLTAFIEHCPKEFSLQLLQTIQDGLCLWLADRSGEWTETEFTYDIVVMYQHIILKVQDLPESLATIEAVAPVLDSIFRHRAPAAAIETFTDFWNLIYAQMTPPTAGWTGPIKHCLNVVGVLPAEMPPTLSILAPAFVPPPSSPRTPVSASFSTPPTAIIRREDLARVQSPQRPQKVFGTFPIIPTTPPSPVNRRHSNSSVRRTPLSAIQFHHNPTKRRRLTSDDEGGAEDKENVNTSLKIPSVAERIRLMEGFGSSNSKKRRFEDDDEESVPEESKPQTRSTKRLKGQMKVKSTPPITPPLIASPAPSFSSNESEDERSVVQTLTTGLPFPTVEKDTEEAAAEDGEEEVDVITPKRTRGNGLRVLTSSTKQATRGPTRSLDSIAHGRKIDLTKVPLRRSISTPEMLLKSVIKNGKRKRTETDMTEHQDSDASVSDVTPSVAARRRAGIRVGPPRHAKKVYSSIPMSDVDVPERAPTMSSDDDPHYGQVTPHHLISPMPARRAVSLGGRRGSSLKKFTSDISKELFGDDLPGSDDTVGSSCSSGSDSESPTKEFLTRQLRRTSSVESISSRR